MKRTIPIVVILLGGWVTFPPGFEALSFDVRKDGNQPIVEWSAASEQGLHHYEVHVITRYRQEPRVEEIEKKGARYVYVYRDHELYKGLGELVTYEVYAALSSGEMLRIGSDQVDYTPTAVRRTWGSIKAMFQ